MIDKRRLILIAGGCLVLFSAKVIALDLFGLGPIRVQRFTAGPGDDDVLTVSDPDSHVASESIHTMVSQFEVVLLNASALELNIDCLELVPSARMIELYGGEDPFQSMTGGFSNYGVLDHGWSKIEPFSTFEASRSVHLYTPPNTASVRNPVAEADVAEFQDIQSRGLNVRVAWSVSLPLDQLRVSVTGLPELLPGQRITSRGSQVSILSASRRCYSGLFGGVQLIRLPDSPGHR